MSGTGHTKGPWKVGQYLGSLSSFHVHMDAGNKGGGIVVVEAVAGITTEQRLANARLIAAAPELLDALKIAEKKLVELENAVSGGDDEIYVEGAILTARAAIAKATGASNG